MLDIILNTNLIYILGGWFLVITTVGSLTKTNETIFSWILYGGLFLILTKYIKLYNDKNGTPSKESVNKMITDLIIILGLFLLTIYIVDKGTDWSYYRSDISLKYKYKYIISIIINPSIIYIIYILTIINILIINIFFILLYYKWIHDII